MPVLQTAESIPPSTAPLSTGCDGRTLKLRFFKSDDCEFSDDEYLVRNVPGRILWKLQLVPTARGRFRLDVICPLDLQESDVT